MVAVVTVCTEWMECQHTLIILVSKMCGQTRQKTFDVKLIRCCRCRHKSFGQSCQKLKFRVCRLPSEYGYIGEPFYSVFCKTVVKWHYIFTGPEITDGLQIGKSFVHNGDDIWCFCIAGKDAIVFERFDLTKLVRTVVHSAELLADQKGAKILFEETESHYVWADEFKTEEVVTNFVSNAINHVDFDKVIEIKMKKENGKVHTSVFNTGVPIPEADIDKIWIKFYKVDKARTREYGGSGIGLSIVKAIMDSMHQKFGVKNYDNGVEFWFELEADNGREIKSEMTEEFAKPVEVKGEKTEQNEP